MGRRNSRTDGAVKADVPQRRLLTMHMAWLEELRHQYQRIRTDGGTRGYDAGGEDESRQRARKVWTCVGVTNEHGAETVERLYEVRSKMKLQMEDAVMMTQTARETDREPR
eukprot:6207188-Pleurochrysis_carterae.AAC.1